MKAAVWNGKQDVRVENVPDPEILNPRDAIVRVTRTAICGSDLHLYNGFVPTMKAGDVLGHEFMGEIVDLGPAVRGLSVGDRVVVSCIIACGACWYCQKGMWSCCDNSNPNAHLADTMIGHSGAGVFGFSRLFGGYSGGQAEYVRVPFADTGCLKLTNGYDDEQVLFLSDILPTGWMAAENADITPGDTVAVFGCGPVGQLTMLAARMMGAERIIAVDDQVDRLAMAERESSAETLNEREVDIVAAIDDMTGGRGPDSVIDAVGLEAHGSGVLGVYDRLKQAVKVETDRPTALRRAMMVCRKGGTISLIGVYAGLSDKIPFGAAFNKGLTIKMGNVNCQHYMPFLLDRIERGEIDPSFIVTHRMSLDDAPRGYSTFNRKLDGCVKVIMQP